jgi:glutaminyl-tRNA synthetase
LFRTTDPEDVSEGGHWHDNLNPDSLEVLATCQLEPSLADAESGERFQFERLGYFCVDSVDSAPGSMVFNRTATLRDTWAKLEARS